MRVNIKIIQKKLKMENPQEQKLKKIRQTKELEYGSFDDNMKNIGRFIS